MKLKTLTMVMIIASALLMSVHLFFILYGVITHDHKDLFQSCIWFVVVGMCLMTNIVNFKTQKLIQR